MRKAGLLNCCTSNSWRKKRIWCSRPPCLVCFFVGCCCCCCCFFMHSSANCSEDIIASVHPLKKKVFYCPFPSDLRSGEELTLETSVFQIFHGGNSTFINSFDKTKFLLLKCVYRSWAILGNLVLSNGSIKDEVPQWKSWKADVSSVNPSSGFTLSGGWIVSNSKKSSHDPWPEISDIWARISCSVLPLKSWQYGGS